MAHKDLILEGMALEAYEILTAVGLDPKSPPKGPRPLSAFEEYKYRGGVIFEDPQIFLDELLARMRDI